MKLNIFFKIKDPINLYHAEQSKNLLIEPNMEVPPHPHDPVYVSICKLPREPFSIYGDKKQCIC